MSAHSLIRVLCRPRAQRGAPHRRERAHAAPERFPDDPAITAVFESAPDEIRLAPSEAARQLRAVVLTLSNPFFVDPPLDGRQIVELFLHGVGADR